MKQNKTHVFQICVLVTEKIILCYFKTIKKCIVSEIYSKGKKKLHIVIILLVFILILLF